MPGILLTPSVCSIHTWTENQCLPLQQNTNHASPADLSHRKQFNIVNESYSPPSDIQNPFNDSSKCHEPCNPLFVSTPSLPVDNCRVPPIKSEFLAKRAKRIVHMYSDDTYQHLQALEVEPPLIEYLTLHGAISEADAQMILAAEQHQQRHVLLRVLGLFDQTNHPRDTSNSSLNMGFSLLLNALRNTGHHSLASYLDYSRRIIPKDSSDYCKTNNSEEALPAPRKLGQFSVCIRLDAVKVPLRVCEELTRLRVNGKPLDSAPRSGQPSSQQVTTEAAIVAGEPPTSYRAVLPSFAAQLEQSGVLCSSDLSNGTDRRSVPNCWIDFAMPKTDKQPQQSGEFSGLSDQKMQTTSKKLHTRPTGCFAKLRLIFDLQRRKRRKPSATRDPAPTTIFHPRLDDQVRLAKLAFLKRKAQEFSESTCDSSLPYHDAVVKYFEQTAGVLVLDCQADSGPPDNEFRAVDDQPTSQSLLRVIVVATKTEVVQRLLRACQEDNRANSKLATDLLLCLRNSGLLDCLQLDDLRLTVAVDLAEVEQATDELEDMVE